MFIISNLYSSISSQIILSHTMGLIARPTQIFRVLAFLTILVIIINILFFVPRDTRFVKTKFQFSLNGEMFNSYASSYQDDSKLFKAQIPPLIIDSKTQAKIDTIRSYLNESTSKKERLPISEIGSYLLVDPNRCGDVDQVDLVILVHTAPANLNKRERIRNTFARESLFYPFHIRIAFLLGKSKDSAYDSKLKLEHAKYNDTVMSDFVDDYHNLTLKGVMGYRWVNDYCSNSKIVLKIDDDVLVNMYKLLYYYFPHLLGKTKSVFCRYMRRSTVKINREGKWAVGNNYFYNALAFPFGYCSGFAVIMTTDLVISLYQASRITPFFWVDDLYLFGMLPYVVGDVTFYDYSLQNQLSMEDEQTLKCTQDFGQDCSIFATIFSDSKGYWQYWNTLKEIFTIKKLKIQKEVVQ